MFKLENTLYGLKQAPRSWYERLSKFLLDHGFKRENIDNMLFLMVGGRNLLIVQVYIDGIIFGAITSSLCDEFSKFMSCEFKMSMMGDLNFFLGLHIKQSATGATICQQKYIYELLKRFNMEDAKPIDIPMDTFLKLDLDEPGPSIIKTIYREIIGSFLYLTTS